MSHMVTCSKCGKMFDRDKIQAVRTGARRYAHLSCDPDNKELVPLIQKEIKKENNQEKEDMDKLKEYISKIYGDQANWPLIMRQIKQYREEYNYTLTGILKSLIYFYEIKGGSVEKSNNGIGIVPFQYKPAFDYYYNLFIIQSQNEAKNVENFSVKVREITIKPPSISNPKRFFNLDDDDKILNKGN